MYLLGWTSSTRELTMNYQTFGVGYVSEDFRKIYFSLK